MGSVHAQEHYKAQSCLPAMTRDFPALASLHCCSERLNVRYKRYNK